MHRIIVTFALILSFGTRIQAQDRPSFDIVRTDVAPKIDGVLDDELWKQPPLIHGEWISYNPLYGEKQALRTEVFHRLRAFLERYEFLLCPVNQVLPFPVEIEYPTEIAGVRMENYIDWMKSCYYISVASHPAISVPAGFTPEGLPVGLQIVGRYRDDFGVLQLAHAFEQATGIWQHRPPAAE